MKAPKNWKHLDRHPLGAEYGDIEGPAWDAFLENFREHGNIGDQKIVLHEGKVLDHWQIYRACVELDKTPEFMKVPKGVDPEVYVSTVNDHRRHETQARAMVRASARRERVIEARRHGQSTRAIAEKEGVSQGQVRRDISESQTTSLNNSSGESGDSPETQQSSTSDGSDKSSNASASENSCDSTTTSPPETVTGQDGKTYPATKPKVEILCDRCRRTGAVKDCARCTEARKAAKGVKGKPASEEAAPADGNGQASGQESGKGSEEEPKDEADQFIPEYVRPAFATAKELAKMSRDLASLLRRIEELAYGPGGRLLPMVPIKQHIQDLKTILLSNRATYLCPYCEQDGGQCDCCKGQGWTNKTTWKAAQEELAEKTANNS